jgi:adenine-specific DNA-methyltransferase
MRWRRGCVRPIPSRPNHNPGPPRHREQQHMARSREISIDALRHNDKRRNIPTAELEPVMDERDKSPIRLAYERRNRDLDPQLVWRGKDEEDWSDLIVQAPPLYIQEKIHPKVLVDDLLRRSRARRAEAMPPMPDLFADFNGLPDKEAVTEFYQHDANWSNRMILGDSLAVMASLAEREGLRGKVQCIYLDPPYGIRFNSNFQWSTTSRDVKDGNRDHVTREPEQVKAFRDTWRDGIHSYLTYLRDRLTVARDLLADTGSIFVQIGDENVHRVRAVMDEVFGDRNFIETISYRTKNMTLGGRYLEGVCDSLLWYAKSFDIMKYRRLFRETEAEGDSHWNQIYLGSDQYRKMSADEINDHDRLPGEARVYQLSALYPAGPFATGIFPFSFRGKTYDPPTGRSWKSPIDGMKRLSFADRIEPYSGGATIRYRLFLDDYPVSPYHNVWLDTAPPPDKRYVVETSPVVVRRCILMTTDPGDLVLDPTCGSGTTAFVAEQWGRRWITIDTSRVALALARARIMGARYPYFLLADSPQGQKKEAEVTRTPPKETPTHGDIRQGFVYERVPHITLKSIANNAEIDVIWEEWQQTLEPLRARLNAALGRASSAVMPGLVPGIHVDGRDKPGHDDKDAVAWEEWQIPREAGADWPEEAKKLHALWWQARIARQKEIDASIAAKAEFEYLYDKPYPDPSRIRVAGPFTVESLSPHRYVAVDQDDSLVHELAEPGAGWNDFPAMVLDHLKTAGVQQAHKEDRIAFTALAPWPGKLVSAEGRYNDGTRERRAAILIGPEFGILSRPDLVDAAREAADAGFDVVIACGFNFDAHSAELDRIGRIPILKARMNPDLHMAGELKNTGAGNLFVVFGEPDIAIEPAGADQIQVRIRGVDVFKPQTGEIVSGGPDTIALWFIDTDYNEESFFVRHAYFLGAATDPYKALKTTLKAEIDEEAWESLQSDTSRPFPKPRSGRIAVKVINHLGDEVMKVFGVR